MDETIAPGTHAFGGEPQYLSVRYTAHVLDVSLDTVRRWIRLDKIEYVRFGRTIRIPREVVYKRKIAA